MALEFLASGSNATENGILLPVTSLYSVIADYQNAIDEINFARLLLNFFEKSQIVLNGTGFNKLGISLSKDLDDPVATTTEIVEQDWTLIYQNYVTSQSSPVILPTPVSGAGKFDLISVFTGAVKVASGSSVATDGVLFAVSDLSPYGSPVYADISLTAGQDNRNLWLAMARYLINNIEVRATGVLSAVTAKNIAVPTIPTLPDAYTAATNPTTGIDASALFSNAFVVQQSLSFTLQTKQDATTKTYDVYVA